MDHSGSTQVCTGLALAVRVPAHIVPLNFDRSVASVLCSLHLLQPQEHGKQSHGGRSSGRQRESDQVRERRTVKSPHAKSFSSLEARKQRYAAMMDAAGRRANRSVDGVAAPNTHKPSGG